MNTEPETLSTEGTHEIPGIKKIDTIITLRTEVYEYLDKCFQLIGLTWDDFFQEQIEETIESIKDQASCWLGEKIQTKLKEI